MSRTSDFVSSIRDLGAGQGAEAHIRLQTEMLAEYLDKQTARETERLALERGPWANGILTASSKVPGPTGGQGWAAGVAVWRFRVPYAWLFVADPNGQGPLWVKNEEDPVYAGPGDPGLDGGGVGHWAVPANCPGVVVPLYGAEGATIYAARSTTTTPAPGYAIVNANGGPTLLATGAGILTGFFVQTVGAAETIQFFDGATAITEAIPIAAAGEVPLNLPFNTSLSYAYAGTTAGVVDVDWQLRAAAPALGAVFLAAFATPYKS